ncbi:hypothetical protein PENTCL1PPCAC_20085 [Pristionchus entomophagus]|uniref:Phospholipid scramblase n=1 Tax=Pristionchus entomophagus TaxID=358040 RepID=A0AAV5TTT1_9BILA|nr:hypothetical protein PENTCL1PPCAC_20085 [Pristionchus entomophagus]
MSTGTYQIAPPLSGAPPSYDEAMSLFLDSPPPSFEQASRGAERLPGAITTEPGVDSEDDIKWMPLPRIDPSSSCPYGLEYLLQLSAVHVKRERWRMLEGKRYRVCNSSGEKIYLASDTGTFSYSVQDQLERHAFTIKRESHCLCYGMASECAVECPPGEPSAFILGSAGMCVSNIVVTDSDKCSIFHINAPLGWTCREEEKLPVLAKSVQVAQIRRRYPDVPLSERYDYVINFPRDLDVRMKAALIATAIKIDVEIAEQKTSRSSN